MKLPLRVCKRYHTIELGAFHQEDLQPKPRMSYALCIEAVPPPREVEPRSIKPRPAPLLDEDIETTMPDLGGRDPLCWWDIIGQTSIAAGGKAGFVVGMNNMVGTRDCFDSELRPNQFIAN